ncbi:hypothetical protein glysoja_012211 [Glycine soja]|nr:hypothetical protein glysoja_012211 [Glycine soja]
MEGTGFGAAAPTPLVRLWRTAFLTLRDETLTVPPRNSTAQLLDNLIFSHSDALLSAAAELPSHEVLSDILFIMELVAATSSDEEDFTRIYAQTSRLIHDICRCVSFELNFSSFSSVLNCFGKMLNLLLRKVATSDDISGICSTTTIIPAIEFLQAVRKTMDVLALKTPVVEDSVMSRFYESFLCCLHLILIDPKCSVSDHVSVFVAVLRMFLVYGVSGRTSGLLVGHEEKEPNSMNPKANREQLNKSDRGTYRPPHLRKRDSLNVKLNRARHSQYMSDSESSTVNVTSSDSEFSDGDGSAKESGRVQNSRVRVASITCIQVSSKTVM